MSRAVRILSIVNHFFECIVLMSVSLVPHSVSVIALCSTSSHFSVVLVSVSVHGCCRNAVTDKMSCFSDSLSASWRTLFTFFMATYLSSRLDCVTQPCQWCVCVCVMDDCYVVRTSIVKCARLQRVEVTLQWIIIIRQSLKPHCRLFHLSGPDVEWRVSFFTSLK